MIGSIAGAAIVVYSTNGILGAWNDMSKINEKKQTLIANTFKYSDLHTKPNGYKGLTLIDNKNRAGILKIKQEIVQKQFRTIVSTTGSRQIEVSTDKLWRNCLIEPINLNMGLPSFRPPDQSKVIIDMDSVITINSLTTKGLSSSLTNTYGTNFVLPETGKFIGEFFSLEGKQVYAFGTVQDQAILMVNNSHTQQTSKMFVAECMGIDPDAVAEKVYEGEQSAADTSFSLSVIGGVIGLCVIFGSVSS